MKRWALKLRDRLPRPVRRVAGAAWRRGERLLAWGVDRGVPPRWVGYRWVRVGHLPAPGPRPAAEVAASDVRVVHPERVVYNPLPCNVALRADLPADPGWWGYAMHDVPARTSGPTLFVTLPEARVLPFVDPQKGYFRPAILDHDRRSVEIREVSFRSIHARRLRRGEAPQRLERATWILERVYDNHSHWLTAHLPKLVLLRDMGMLADILLPPARTETMDASMRMLGLDPEAFATFELDRPLDVGRLTVLATDRFRPDLLRPVRDALAPSDGPGHRRVFISRARAERRRLLTEDAVWPVLDAAGFERVFMEDLEFEQQVALMAETAVLVAPHGAGLTNMMFCPEGTHVVEMADLGFPNPNFYAVAAAMGHRYWLLAAEGVGDRHPLEKDLRIDSVAVESLLAQLLGGAPVPPA